jgi:hypothetical protein
VNPKFPSIGISRPFCGAVSRTRVFLGPVESIREIEGSFALVARQGKTVRMARSMDRPVRYPALASDLLSNVHKLGATKAEILGMLKWCGFSC